MKVFYIVITNQLPCRGLHDLDMKSNLQGKLCHFQNIGTFLHVKLQFLRSIPYMETQPLRVNVPMNRPEAAWTL